MLYNGNMQKLNGKTVLITGSSRGIGAETAMAFAKEGCNVVITFLEEVSEAKKVSEKCLELGAKSVEVMHLDVKSNESIKSLIKTLALKFGGIDILVNNAGVIRWKKFESQTDDDIDQQIATNLTGLIKMTKQALPLVKDTIINLASGAGSHPVKDLSVYCATKHGVKGFTEVLAIEEPGLKIYTVSPTMTSTEMTDYHGMPPAKVAEVIVGTAKDGYGNESGSDIKVWEVIKDSYATTPW
jgi:NAD(P)-dependent dehydrogenase (short-subunit alcohol dehydrogenase family)